MIVKSKTSYFREKITECASDQKALDRVVNSLLHRREEFKLPTGDTLYLLDQFNNYFSSKITKIRHDIESSEQHGVEKATPPHTNLTDLQDLIPPLSTFEEATVDEVKAIISKSPSKSCSLDPLPTNLLKCHIDILAPIITKIVNMSLATGRVPPQMKLALVSPLIKKISLDPNEYKNYRPVSNLTFLSKVLEKVVSARLQKHMDENHLEETLQSAYRKAHSTETTVLLIHSDILRAIDKKEGIILILLDLSAAFDTLDHDILEARLHSHIGLTGCALGWASSYLSSRTQSISIKGMPSDPSPLLYGVPQGSVLGPKFYSIYCGPVADIARSHGVNILLYADDTQLYIAFDLSKPANQIISRIEACVDDISSWMRTNRLKLNENKTELLVITSPRQSTNHSKIELRIGTNTVRTSSEARNLGIVFDNTMKMQRHISNICQSSYFHLRNIRSIRKYLSKRSAEQLIHAFVTTRLDHCNSLLCGLPETALHGLQLIQNTAARIIALKRKYDHISPVLHALHWLPIRHRITFSQPSGDVSMVQLQLT